MLFPGQGAQSVGMLDGLAADHPVIHDTLTQASEVLGYDVADVITHGPADKLDQTAYTQPLMLAADVAVYQAWRAAGGPAPAYVAGHSLGEYAALVAAGTLSFADALRVTSKRATAMTDAVAGVDIAMAAIIGLDDATVQKACDRAAQATDAVVSPANYNAPLQVVIAGQADAVTNASEQARQLGARMVRPIAVSVPSHCALMRPATGALESALGAADMQPPSMWLLHNVDAQPRADTEAIKQALCDQLWQPVHWVRCVEQMRDAGVDVFLECGPGRVLAGLNKRIDKSLTTVSLGEPGTFLQAVSEAA